MKDLGRVGVVSFFLLGVSASGVASAGDVPDAGIVETTVPSPAPATQDRPGIQKEQPPSGNPLWGIPLKQLSATRDRPIFSPSRRPPPPVMVDPPVAVVPTIQGPKEPDRPRLSLLGTIVNGDDGFGIFMDQTTKASLRLRIGAVYQGWTLRLLQPGSVTLVKGQESAVLAFPKPASDGMAAAPARLITTPAPTKRTRHRGSPGPTPPLNPPPQSTSFRAPAQTSGNPALRP